MRPFRITSTIVDIFDLNISKIDTYVRLSFRYFLQQPQQVLC